MWALGCIIYACLVGHPPFESQTVQSTFHKARSLKYELPQDMSKHAKDLIISLLALNPEERPNIIEVKQHPFFQAVPKPLSQKLNLKLDTDCSYYEYYEDIPSVSVRNRKANSMAANIEALRSKTPEPIFCCSPTSKVLVQNKENISPPRRSLDLRGKKLLNTHNLKPFTHRLKNEGQISIDNHGWAKLVLKNRVLEVSQNGMSILYNGKAGSIHTLSKGAQKMYEYLKKVLELVKSQTPKVIIEEKSCKFILMSNFPNPNFEAYLPDNVQILYQLGSQTMEIIQTDTRTTVNPLAHTSSVTSEQLRYIQRAMEGMHKCVQQAKEKKARSFI